MTLALPAPSRTIVERLLSFAFSPGTTADGLLTVHDERFYRAVALHGALGLGESYMAGWWDCPRLDRFFENALNAGLLERCRFSPDAIWLRVRERVFNEQSRARARVIADRHYDLGNDLFESFLDPYNQYTCGYFEGTTSLNVAQEQKLALICRKLELRAGDRLLDIGCGWGGLARYAAEHVGCHVTGVSISREQIAYGQAACKGLPVEFVDADYRSLTGTYDKIVSVGMIEHVGYKNYRTFMNVARRLLKPDGLFLLHAIGKGSDDIPVGDPWLLKYIFPGGMIPTPRRLTTAFEGIFDFVDLHEFGSYYDLTLMAWAANFERNWPSIRERYDERFGRMWRYYLLSCAAMFRVRKLHLFQYVLRPRGGPTYASVRSTRQWRHSAHVPQTG